MVISMTHDSAALNDGPDYGDFFRRKRSLGSGPFGPFFKVKSFPGDKKQLLFFVFAKRD